MAEVTMKRLTLAGLAQEKEEVLKRLAFFGAVEIHDAAPLVTEEEAAQYRASATQPNPASFATSLKSSRAPFML